MLTDVPKPGNTLNITQNPIRVNFQTIDSAFSINHIPYNDGSGQQGMHGFISLVQVGSIPTVPPPNTPIPLATSATQIGLYCDTNANTTLNELYFQRSSGLASSGYPITAGFQNATVNGWTILPSGMKMKWGRGTFVHNVGFIIPNGGTNGPSIVGLFCFLTVVTVTDQVTFNAAASGNTITAKFSDSANHICDYFVIGT